MKQDNSFSLKITILFLFALVLVYCGGDSGSKDATAYELSHDPLLLTKKDANYDNLMLWGIKLGDPESKIPKDKIFETNEFGWIMCHGGARFRVKEGKVTELRLSELLAERTGFLEEKEITDTFGTPVKTEMLTDNEKQYFYNKKNIKIIVTWDSDVGVVESIRVIDSAAASK